MEEKQETEEQKLKSNGVDKFFTFLPFVLLLPQIAGGALGGVCGAIGWAINSKAMEKEKSKTWKYSICSLVTVFSFLLYALAVFIILLIFPDLIPAI